MDENTKKWKRMSDEISEELGDFEGCLGRMRNIELQLSNFIANSSVKINNTNQDKIRRFISDIMEQAILQNNAIHCLIGRLIEHKDSTTAILAKTDEVFSYGDATKKVETKTKPVLRNRSTSRKRSEGTVAIIYPMEELESESTKRAIKENINPVHLKIGINKGGILMELDTQQNYEKLEIELQSNKNLKDKFTVKKSKKD